MIGLAIYLECPVLFQCQPFCMTIVAVLSSTVATLEAENRRMHQLEVRILTDAFRCIGRELEVVRWDNPSIDWSRFESVIIFDTWDYTDRLPRFLSILRTISEQTNLFNSFKTVEWNARKRYLLDLSAASVPIVPTILLRSLTSDAVAKCFKQFHTERLVLKPETGASGVGQLLLTSGEHSSRIDRHAHPGHWLAQPFQESIRTEGELSLIFAGSTLSHAVRKYPSPNDYRVQRMYGGKDEPAVAPPDAIDLARLALSTVKPIPLYARVDLVRLNSGQTAVMELELIEPYLYPDYSPTFGNLLATQYLASLQKQQAG